jgi:antitoxin (DNA-binding transcriptional repressor) of toxin-antitoxin stability system
LAHGVAVYNRRMAKHVIHITEKEAAASSVATLLAHVRAGAEVVIENGERALAVLHAAEPVRGRAISESIALAEAHAKELGYEPTMDPEFAADLAGIINSRKPRNVSKWE